MKTFFRIIVGLFFLPATVANFFVGFYLVFYPLLPEPVWVDNLITTNPNPIFLYYMGITMIIMTIPVGVACIGVFMGSAALIIYAMTGILFSSALLVFRGEVKWVTIFSLSD